jgi:hypothetical protein
MTKFRIRLLEIGKEKQKQKQKQKIILEVLLAMPSFFEAWV